MGRRLGRLIAVALLAYAPLAAAEVTTEEAIGWRLFFDPLLSKPKNFSCASCHIPSKGFESGEPLSRGAHGDILNRNTPTVVNLADAEFFFWDGRASSLEEQAGGPMENPLEMDLALDQAVARVNAQPHYKKAFAQMGVDEICADDIVGAIAAFERRLETGQTRFDRWMHGDRSALTEQEERGRMLFFTKGECALCHNGRNLADGDFHNIGTATEADPGRYAIEPEEYYLGAFKTPSLRNWKGREPFMHDGRFATMRDVLEFYSDPPKPELGASEINPLQLSGQEIEDLLAFLETLNGEWPDLERFEQAWKALGVE